MTRTYGGENRINWVVAIMVLASCLVLSALVFTGAVTASQVRWFQAPLEHGETNGYRWTVGAKGPKHKQLGRICAQIAIVEPAQEGAPYVEESDSTECGRLETASDSVVGEGDLASGGTRVTVLEALYRPVVRKVTVVFSTGDHKVFLPRIREIPNRVNRGIPAFRYFAAASEGKECIRRIATFNAADEVIFKERRPACRGDTETSSSSSLRHMYSRGLDSRQAFIRFLTTRRL